METNKKITDAQKREEILKKKQATMDAIARKRAERKQPEQVVDSNKEKKYRKFRVTDAYKSLLKKIKDEFDETINTQEAVDVAIEALEEAPAEQVVAACVEVLAETIDILQENVETLSDVVNDLPEPTEEVVEEKEEIVEDSAKKVQDAVKRAKAILLAKKK